jgi:hypothetical protein
MTGREDEVIRAMSRCEVRDRTDLISAASAIVRSSITKRAVAAALIVVVTLYFYITWSWISQINEYIGPFENLLTLRICM